MQITRQADAPDEPFDMDQGAHFDGDVRRRDFGAIPTPSGTAFAVTFAPGARTHWHAHPDGQVLYVTDGEGRVGSRDGSVTPIHIGDLVYAAPGEEHWHGAATTEPVTHVALSFGATAWAERVEG